MDTNLTFVIGSELFAVSVSNVLEVLQKQAITRVPKTPEHILGIINFRGDILPVVDMRRKFNLPQIESDANQIIIVFETGEAIDKITVAATADGVRDVIEIQDEDIKPVPELGLSFSAKFLKGFVHKENHFILLLDVDKLFSVKDLINEQSADEDV